MFAFRRFCFVVLILSAACNGNPAQTTALPSQTGEPPSDGGGAGQASTTGGSMMPIDMSPPKAPAGTDTCTEAAMLVYVVDSDTELFSFRPDTGTFTSIGKLDCPTMGGSPIPSPIPIPGLGGSPFSMAVDRDGIAWVLYDTGELFRVDTKDASCTATARMPGEASFQTFGMGFASDAASSTAETLYIASNGGGGFGALDTTTGAAKMLGTVSGSAELTGTGAGELWGFFPDTSPPRIDLMDKTSGKALRSIPLSAIGGMPVAWAFAFWGGDFWLFLQRASDASTVVYRVNSQTGELTTPIPDSGKRIVGAGVSTCAPLTII